MKKNPLLFAVPVGTPLIIQPVLLPASVEFVAFQVAPPVAAESLIDT
jgi:hypothetical protein